MSNQPSEPEADWVHPDVLDDARGNHRQAPELFPVCSSFNAVFDAVNNPGEKAIIPKDCVTHPTEFGFTESPQYTLRCGALQTYRDDREEDSIVLWEYPTYYLARVDQFNPEHSLMDHVVFDKPELIVAGAGIAAGLGFYLDYREQKNQS